MSVSPTGQSWIASLRRPYRQGLVLARCDYSKPVYPHTANTPTPQAYLSNLKGALIAARNTAIGMLQNGYDIVSVLADKALAPDGSLPYGDATSFFGEKPQLAPMKEADEHLRAAFAKDAIITGRLLWHVAPELPRVDIVTCIDTLAKAKPTVNGQVKGPAGTTTELTVYLVGHGIKDAQERFTLAYDVTLAPYLAGVKVLGGYTISQLLEDLALNTRWQHLLIIADACNAGAALNNDCYVPEKAETFIDSHWHSAYHRASYQFIGSSLNDTQGQSAEAWQGTLFSMAMDGVLWCTDPTAFAGGASTQPYNWATASYVGDKLRDSINSIMQQLYPGATDLAPTCVHGRLNLAEHAPTLFKLRNLGQFLFVRHNALAQWPYEEVNHPPIQGLHPMAGATAITTTCHGNQVSYQSAADPSWNRQVDFGRYDSSRFITIVFPQTSLSGEDLIERVKKSFDLCTLPHLPSDLRWQARDDITCTLLTDLPFGDSERRFVLLAVCTSDEYETALRFVTKAYQPGLVLAFSPSPNTDSVDVLFGSSFTPSTHHMPQPLSAEMTDILSNVRLTRFSDHQALAHLSPNVRCIDVAQTQPTSTEPLCITLSSVWDMFKFLNHRHSDSPMRSPLENFLANIRWLLSLPAVTPTCTLCNIIPACVIVPFPTDVLFRNDDTIRAGLYAAAPLFTSPMSLPHIPVKLVEFSLTLNTDLTVDVTEVQMALRNLTFRNLAHNGGFLYHAGTRPGCVILDFIGSLSYVWALRAHLACNGGLLEGMEVMDIVVVGAGECKAIEHQKVFETQIGTSSQSEVRVTESAPTRSSVDSSIDATLGELQTMSMGVSVGRKEKKTEKIRYSFDVKCVRPGVSGASETTLTVLSDAVDVIVNREFETIPMRQIWAIDGLAEEANHGRISGEHIFAIWTGCSFLPPTKERPLSAHYFAVKSRDERSEIIQTLRHKWAELCGKNLLKNTHVDFFCNGKYRCCHGALGSAGCKWVVLPHAQTFTKTYSPAVEFSVRYRILKTGRLDRDEEVGTLTTGTLVIRPQHSVALFDARDRLVPVQEENHAALGALWDCTPTSGKRHTHSITGFTVKNESDPENGTVVITVGVPPEQHTYRVLHIRPDTVLCVFNGDETEGKILDQSVHLSAAGGTLKGEIRVIVEPGKYGDVREGRYREELARRGYDDAEPNIHVGGTRAEDRVSSHAPAAAAAAAAAAAGRASPAAQGRYDQAEGRASPRAAAAAAAAAGRASPAAQGRYDQAEGRASPRAAAAAAAGRASPAAQGRYDQAEGRASPRAAAAAAAAADAPSRPSHSSMAEALASEKK